MQRLSVQTIDPHTNSHPHPRPHPLTLSLSHTSTHTIYNTSFSTHLDDAALLDVVDLGKAAQVLVLGVGQLLRQRLDLLLHLGDLE